MLRRFLLRGVLLAAGILPVAGFAQQKSGLSGTPRTLTPYQVFALKQHVVASPASTTCYGSGINTFTSIRPPAEFVRSRAGARVAANPNAARFIVRYRGFTPEAQTAFQYAVDIWASILQSSVPIYVDATWSALGNNVLGSARPGEFRGGSDGTQKAFGIYPVALAEKIARRPLNADGTTDIVASFNRSIDWYYGTDAKPGAGQYDLVSVVLHELAHGLGFFGFADVEGRTATFAAGAVFDHFIENASGQNLLSTPSFTQSPTSLFTQFTNNNMFFNGPNVVRNTGSRARLFAPTTYNAGSSIYHLNEATYPAGNPNSLMSPQFGQAEAIHDPGPITRNIFNDIEWKTTSLLHTPLEDTESTSGIVLTARVESDTAFDAGSLRLFVRRGRPTATDSTFQQVTPTLSNGTYSYTLPSNLTQGSGQLWYYFSVRDASGRIYTNPGKNPTNGQVYHNFSFGPDNVAPSVVRSGYRIGATSFAPVSTSGVVGTILTTAADSLLLSVIMADDRNTGITSAVAEIQLNGAALPNIPLRYVGDNNASRGDIDSVYIGSISFIGRPLNAGDRIRYRFIARDARGNTTTLPAGGGFFELLAAAPQTTARDRYVTTFDGTPPTADFAVSGFTINQAAGFSSPALQTEHPYRNGSNFEFSNNYTATLLAPIRIKSNPDSAVIRFNEIALVEPNDAGTSFGDDGFYDYVVVEGSKDGGRSWQTLVDPYNARAQADWLSTYNGQLVPGSVPEEQNSAAVGTPALYRTRTVSLFNGGLFNAGETILIRFRLYVDQLANGWGWAIDNLQVQPPPPVLSAEPTVAEQFRVYPNPARGSVRVEAQLRQEATTAGMTILNASGQTLQTRQLPVQNRGVQTQLDISTLPAGLYYFQLQTQDSVQTRKVVVTQ